MRVLMLTDSLSKGGTERQLLELIKGLKIGEPEMDILLVLLSDVVDYNYVYELPIKIRIVKRQTKKDITVFAKLNRLLNEFKPDIIHTWSTMSSFYVSFLKIFRGGIFVNNSILNAYTDMNFFHHEFLKVRFSGFFSTILVANSKAGLCSYRISPKEGICIYNGVDLKRFEHLKQIETVEMEILGRKKENLYVAAMVAAFEERKDYDTLIDAAVEACSLWPDIVFLLIGDGSQIETMKRKVPLEFLNKRILFTGNRDDIESILQIIDVGILISPSEGLSNAIIEYMTTGKPVIATKEGGTGELVKHGWNGYLVDQKNPKQIINRIDKLKNNPQQAYEMGQNGRKWIYNNLDNKTITSKYLQLYHKLLESSQKKRKFDKKGWLL